jgi:hypothetical protein
VSARARKSFFVRAAGKFVASREYTGPNTTVSESLTREVGSGEEADGNGEEEGQEEEVTRLDAI